MAWLWTEDHVVPIPKATSESHLRENLEACEFKLDGEDVDKIASIDREQRIDEGPDDIWNR
jgi:2,5-diketo-D-gluconate reductase B